MLTWIALRFAEGTLFLVGLAVCVAGAWLGIFVRRRRVQSFAFVATALGAVLVALSATPQPVVLYIVWAMALATVTAVMHKGTSGKSCTGIAALAVFSVLSVLLAALELPYHIAPALSTPQQGTLCVVGDSLSMGADAQELNWPERLAAQLGLEARNYSFGGAKARTALHNARRVEGANALVIVEIGGNDVLSRTPLDEFEASLDELLRTVTADRREVVMFELPLPPLHGGYGRIQRRLARQYNVTLIPKRYLARVIGTPGATTDGLHLSHAGHELLAERMAALFR